MNKQVEQIRAEIERLKAIADYQLDNCKVDKSAWRQQAEVCKKILSFINSMGEDRPEPISPADVGFEALGKVWDEEARKDSNELTHSVTKLSDQDEPVSEDMEAEFLRAAHNLREQPTLSAWFRHFYNLGKQQIMKGFPTWKRSGKLIEGALLDRGILYIPRYMIELSELRKLPKENLV